MSSSGDRSGVAEGSGASTTASRVGRPGGSRRDPPELATALVIGWSHTEPNRVGEVALLPDDGTERLLGRGGPQLDDAFPRLLFHRQRPGRLERTAVLEGPTLSRSQLRVRPSQGGVHVTRVGRCPVRVSGEPRDTAMLVPGDTLLLEDELLLFCTRRVPELPPLQNEPCDTSFAFGEPDAHGIVGESPEVWALRERIAFLAGHDAHVLILGESGCGKELCARALHRLSRRATRPFVARNAATLPAGLIDAELFGHAKNYPNSGTPERAGLFGEADGSTLFLDEIGELAGELQAHLLRVMDAGGEYQRLGDSTLRRADVRMMAATNRDEDTLKHDLSARFKLRLRVRGLGDHAEDIPLLVRHLLRHYAAEDPRIRRRFFDEVTGHARIGPLLLDALLRHRYALHVRELEALLWSSMAESPRDVLELTPDVTSRLRLATRDVKEPDVLEPHVIQEALDRHDGNQARAFRELGLKNRDVLYRLIKKHGLVVRQGPAKRG